MIFVTVGTDNHEFTRLVKAMDDIAGRIKEEVIIQKGHTKYQTKNARSFSFDSEEKIAKFFKTADLIVGHAGAGTVISALSNHKNIIVMPRLSRYNEHVNDHQLDLARDLGSKEVVLVADSEKDLESIVLKNKKTKKMKSEVNELKFTIENFIRSSS